MSKRFTKYFIKNHYGIDDISIDPDRWFLVAIGINSMRKHGIGSKWLGC